MNSRLSLFALALAIGALIVFVGNTAVDLVLGRIPFADGTLGSIDAPDVAAMHLFDAELPMGCLALVGSRSRALWATAVLLTVIFSAYSVYQLWLDSLTGFAGGANIGLGLIMLVSPFVTLFIVAIVAAIRRSMSRSRQITPSPPISRPSG